MIFSSSLPTFDMHTVWLNFFFRNLYQPQKLLSINNFDAGGLGVIGGHKGGLLVEPESAMKDEPSHVDDKSSGISYTKDVDTSTVFPALAFLGTALVVLFMLNQYYKGRSKPKRKRPRMKKFHGLMYGTKVPSV